jgi:hypothetical protein
MVHRAATAHTVIVRAPTAALAASVVAVVVAVAVAAAPPRGA